jgi:LysR family transcriptional regulator, chromosome initiation inhibitor
LQAEFVAAAIGLRSVSLRQIFVPSSEGQVRAVLAGWGVSAVPELLARPLLESGQLVNISPKYAHWVQLYWHCWNLESEVLEAMTNALARAAKQQLV